MSNEFGYDEAEKKVKEFIDKLEGGMETVTNRIFGDFTLPEDTCEPTMKNVFHPCSYCGGYYGPVSVTENMAVSEVAFFILRPRPPEDMGLARTVCMPCFVVGMDRLFGKPGDPHRNKKDE